MSYQALTLRDGWPVFVGIGGGFLVFGAGVGLLLLIDQSLGSADSKTRVLCDAQVEALLHSRDLVEVTRAGIIIDRLNCAMRRRL